MEKEESGERNMIWVNNSRDFAAKKKYKMAFC